MSELALALSGISKSYQVGDTLVPALKSVDLTLAQASVTAIRGPSGSGKSTLLNICGLIDHFDQGSYRLADQDVGHLDEKGRTLLRRQHIGFVFQSYNLVPVMTAAENIDYPLMLLGLSAQERQERVADMLEQVGLGGLGERLPDRLSGGQRQRVAIARALVKSPTLVIADEPTANLDSHTAGQIVDLMRKMAQQRRVTFLIATHDERMTDHCDQVYGLSDGVLL